MCTTPLEVRDRSSILSPGESAGRDADHSVLQWSLLHPVTGVFRHGSFCTGQTLICKAALPVHLSSALVAVHADVRIRRFWFAGHSMVYVVEKDRKTKKQDKRYKLRPNVPTILKQWVYDEMQIFKISRLVATLLPSAVLRASCSKSLGL